MNRSAILLFLLIGATVLDAYVVSRDIQTFPSFEEDENQGVVIGNLPTELGISTGYLPIVTDPCAPPEEELTPIEPELDENINIMPELEPLPLDPEDADPPIPENIPIYTDPYDPNTDVEYLPDDGAITLPNPEEEPAPIPDTKPIITDDLDMESNVEYVPESDTIPKVEETEDGIYVVPDVEDTGDSELIPDTKPIITDDLDMESNVEYVPESDTIPKVEETEDGIYVVPDVEDTGDEELLPDTKPIITDDLDMESNVEYVPESDTIPKVEETEDGIYVVPDVEDTGDEELLPDTKPIITDDLDMESNVEYVPESDTIPKVEETEDGIYVVPDVEDTGDSELLPDTKPIITDDLDMDSNVEYVPESDTIPKVEETEDGIYVIPDVEDTGDAESLPDTKPIITDDLDMESNVEYVPESDTIPNVEESEDGIYVLPDVEDAGEVDLIPDTKPIVTDDLDSESNVEYVPESDVGEKIEESEDGIAYIPDLSQIQILPIYPFRFRRSVDIDTQPIDDSVDPNSDAEYLPEPEEDVAVDGDVLELFSADIDTQPIDDSVDPNSDAEYLPEPEEDVAVDGDVLELFSADIDTQPIDDSVDPNSDAEYLPEPEEDVAVDGDVLELFSVDADTQPIDDSVDPNSDAEYLPDSGVEVPIDGDVIIIG